MNSSPLPSTPSITVVIATYNSAQTLERCLQSVRSQVYPSHHLRILIADGASSDDTLNIAERFGAHVLHVPPDRQSAEYNKGVAIRQADGDLLLLIDHDNVLPHELWLERMLEPFRDIPDLVASQTLRYRYDPSGSLLDRYCALFGASDPVVFSLGKCDRRPWFGSDIAPFGRQTPHANYILVDMDPEKIPTLGANGCLVRRDLLQTHARITEDEFFHIDVHVDLIRQGYTQYAFTKDDILHLTSYKHLSSFLARRRLFMNQYYAQKQVRARRRFQMVTRRDLVRLLGFCLGAVTIIPPTLVALRGYQRIRDRAWFLHPVLSLALLWIYASAIVYSVLQNERLISQHSHPRHG